MLSAAERAAQERVMLPREMITVGKNAPPFSLPSTAGGTVKMRELADQWAVLFFYPKDMTTGCTNEVRAFRDAKAEFDKRGVLVFGVSKDSIERHETFIEKEELNFPLLSDENAKMLEKYGAWGEKKLYGREYMGIIRSTVILAPDGTIAKHFPKVRVKGHVEQVLEALDELLAG